MIRPAILEDAEAIAKVHVASWQVAYKGLMPAEFLASLSLERCKAQWQQWLEQAEQVIMICEEKNKIVGFSSAGKARDSDLNNHLAELYTLYLLSDFWGKGYGKQLYQETLKELTTRGFKQLSLWVLESNKRGRTFYEAMDLRPDGQSKTESWQNDLNINEVRYIGDLGHSSC